MSRRFLDELGAVRLERDVILAEGPEAAAYLHGQLSQDVEGLAVGSSALSLLLAPQGKVEVALRITRRAADRFVLDTEAGFGDAALTSLRRFQLRSDLELVSAPWTAVGLRGPGSDLVEAVAEIDVAVPWPGGGRDLLGPTVDVPLDLAPPEALEPARIEVGVPRMGVDVVPGAIPHETGLLAASVSFTKGCYRGQELVERIDARGASRRGLARLRAEVPLAAGDALVADGAEVGAVTSGAVADDGGWVGLGTVRAGVEDGSTVTSVSGTAVQVVDRVAVEGLRPPA